MAIKMCAREDCKQTTRNESGLCALHDPKDPSNFSEDAALAAAEAQVHGIGQWAKVPRHLRNAMEWIREEPCQCGKGTEVFQLVDARGIPVGRLCCEHCVVDVAKPYRREIFEDSNYETDEPIDEEF